MDWEDDSSRYSGPCFLRPPIQPEKHGLKLKVVLKWRDVYSQYIKSGATGPLRTTVKVKEILKWRVLNHFCKP